MKFFARNTSITSITDDPGPHRDDGGKIASVQSGE